MDGTRIRLRWLVAGCLVAALSSHVCAAAENGADSAAVDTTAATAPSSKLKDPEDGWFDVSSFLDTGHGFVPIVVPVTEPAIGYGAGGGLVFIKRNPPLASGKYRRPNMTMVGGMGTENGTWAGFAGHSASWDEDRLQTLLAGLYGSIQLDFYGIGEGELNDHPVRYEIEPLGGLLRAHYRIGDSRIQLGLAYGYASMAVSFDGDSLPAGVSTAELESRIAGVTPALVFDSRDNAFTPTRGAYGSIDAGIFAEALGGTSNFERYGATAIGHVPIGRAVFLGARGDATFSTGDCPFYARPYISLRGAPVLRYMGENAASVEFETRWQFWKRISAVGFVGTGIAWIDTDVFDSEQSIVTGGGGLRYEIARRYGLHMGADVAWGPDETAVYVQFGSAWAKP